MRNQPARKQLHPNVVMKPSGMKWIGAMPLRSEVKRLKYVADLNMGQSPPSEEYNSDHVGTPFLQGNAEFGAHHPTPKIYCPTAKKHATPGDILLSVRAPVGALNIADQEYGIGRGLCAIRPRINQLERRYAKYLLEVVRAELHVVATGSTYEAVTVDDVSNLTCVVPPLSEQTQIAAFLDRKTEKIDELIRGKERRIELLREQRTALINHAVTKGLDPTAGMKPSGVGWIGEIPRDWSIIKVKYLTHQIIDGTHYTPEYQDSGIPFLRVTDIHTKKVDLTKVKYITPELHQELTRRCKPEKGNLLLSKNGTIGITRVIDWDFEFSIFVSLCLIKFRTETYSPHFFSYLFQSQVIDQQLKESSKTSTVTNLHLDKIRELFVVKPPLSQQTQIIHFLDAKTGQIDELISAEERKIELLKEYRHSLISEAVTGKIDVRNED